VGKAEESLPFRNIYILQLITLSTWHIVYACV